MQLYSYKHSRVTTRFFFELIGSIQIMNLIYFVNSNYLELRLKSILISHFKQKRFICSVSIYVLHILDLLESPEHNSISVIGLIFEGGDVIVGESSVRWDEIEQVEKVRKSRSTRKSDSN